VRLRRRPSRRPATAPGVRLTLLQRLPQKAGEVHLSQVNRVWLGQTVVCIASGPSLTAAQVERARVCQSGGRAKVIVCNDNYQIAPWADVLYFADAKWLGWHQDKPGFKAFAGQKCTLAASAIDFKAWPELHVLPHDGGEGLSWNPAWLRTGSNSGHQILNIAALSGASLILLLGYDARPGKDGRKHHFGDHPDGSAPPYDKMRSAMRTVDRDAKARGIRIVNCSPGSALDCFEKGTIESWLGDGALQAVAAANAAAKEKVLESMRRNAS
jgi:hypothetical protein